MSIADISAQLNDFLADTVLFLKAEILSVAFYPVALMGRWWPTVAWAGAISQITQLSSCAELCPSLSEDQARRNRRPVATSWVLPAGINSPFS